MELKSFEKFINEEEKTSYRIFQDMDGCLTNFDKKFIEIPENTEHLSMSEYSDKYGQTAAWHLVSTQGENYWSTMEWMPDGKKLWDYVNKNPGTIILSSPSRDPKCYSGKEKWLQQHLGIGFPEKDEVIVHNDIEWDPNKVKVILNSQKHKFCKYPYWILIDDSEDKINKWREAGGVGILHTSADETIDLLKKLRI